MRSIVLLALAAQAYSRELALKHTKSAANCTDKLVDKLLDRVFRRKGPRLSATNLENTTLQKGPGHVAQHKTLLAARQPQLVSSLKRRTSTPSRKLLPMSMGTRRSAFSIRNLGALHLHGSRDMRQGVQVGASPFREKEIHKQKTYSEKEQAESKSESKGWKSTDPLLEVKNVFVQAEEDQDEGGEMESKTLKYPIPILRGTSLTIRPGEIHAIMGQNGCGKSTLGKVLFGHEYYNVTKGSITFKGEDLLSLASYERVHRGVFYTYQDPEEIEGVPLDRALWEMHRAIYKGRGRTDAKSKLDLIRSIMPTVVKLNIDPTFLLRNYNDGFSGGEKKRNEILQMTVCEPDLAVLDEIDSGLDRDALRAVSATIKEYLAEREEDAKLGKGLKPSLLIITHYRKLLDMIRPDFVHIMLNGQVVETGGEEFLDILDKEGYGHWKKKFKDQLEAAEKQRELEQGSLFQKKMGPQKAEVSWKDGSGGTLGGLLGSGG